MSGAVRTFLHTVGGDRIEHACLPLTPDAHAARVETVARALHDRIWGLSAWATWDIAHPDTQHLYRAQAATALTALGLAP